MKFHVLTLFPEMFDGVLHDSMLGRAEKKNVLEFNMINIRDFAVNKHKRVDDYPYGGGRGMVMQAEPIYNAYCDVCSKLSQRPHVVYMSPKGTVLTQAKAAELSCHSDLVILCGHYEGVDQRIIDEIVDEEISIGDYVLTGGEIPAMVLIDSISRMLEGVLSNEDSFTDESHYGGLLEYPHYTRPPVFNGREVPEVLLSGNHALISKWRMEKALEETAKKRPDMLEKYQESKKL